MVSKASTERVVYQVADADDHGILIDLLGHTLRRLSLIGHSDLKWSIFDLDWMQRDDVLCLPRQDGVDVRTGSGATGTLDLPRRVHSWHSDVRFRPSRISANLLG
jgi:hypothetical protein